MKQAPQKRIKALQPLSRDHHHGLLLCWKIRTGLKKNVASERIKKYINWFWKIHLKPHFKLEEQYVFPVLGNKNELVKKALSDHRRLKRLFENENDEYKYICLIEEELEAHIRFEERILFNEIQKVVTKEQLKQIEEFHTENHFNDNLADEFWK